MRSASIVPAMGLVLICFLACRQGIKNSQGDSFLQNVNQVAEKVERDSAMLSFFDRPGASITPAFTPLTQGSTRPLGWLARMMRDDLEHGIVGALDELYPGIRKDDLFATARRGGLEDVPEMGDLVLTGAAWEQSIMWWNAETIGNWWDGFIRHAFLTRNQAAMDQAKEIVSNLLASQDPDGYIGIYKPNLRYQHEGSNGELWAQTTAFRTLLGYYAFTQDRRVLNAVEKAMTVTMQNYGPDGRNPFQLKNAFGGVTHGLMLTDVCETLFQITGNEKYQDYAVYLYRAFSTHNLNRAFNDLRYPFLMERDSLFTGHGVHTYEHFRSLVNAYYQTGYTELSAAYENALFKLQQVILPGGAGHGNEWLAGMTSDPHETHTEYCGMLELRNSLSSMFQKSGERRFADQAEKLTYNGMMGFRNASGTAITYGKGDNCFMLDGHHHGKSGPRKDVRYKYSPTHSEPAVCCVPNYARNYPYFLDQLWMRAENGLVAAMYAPCKLNTTIHGTDITISQLEEYPFTDALLFQISPAEPIVFALFLRKPEWATTMIVQSEGASQSEENGFLKIEKQWRAGDQVRIEFSYAIRELEVVNGEAYIQRGPLVFAYPIPHREKIIKQYTGTDFTDYHCFPLDDHHLSLTLPPPDAWSFEYTGSPTATNPWYADPPKLKSSAMTLVPMGSTVLRRVTFP